jgi:hypothetical protein
MSKVRFGVVLAFLAFVGLIAPGRVSASTTWFEFGPVESADIVTLTYAAAGLTGGEYYAGQYNGTVASTQSGLSSSSAVTFQTFCVDLFHDVSNNQQYEVTLTPTVGNLNNATQINYLYQTYGEQYINGTYSTLVVNGTTYHNVAADDYAAALQLAIWDELANNGSTSGPLSYSIVTGSSSMVLSLVSSFLAAANGDPLQNGNYWQANASQPAGYDQGQSFLMSSAPSSLLLGAMALGCLMPFCAWRRRQLLAPEIVRVERD